MQPIRSILSLALLVAAVILPGCANVTTLGKINDTTITSVTTRGVFSPSSRVLIGHVEGQPGVEVLAHAEGPGFVPSVATAGGIAGGAALLRPSRTTVGGASASNSSSNTAGNSGQISATSVNDIPVSISNTPAGKTTPPNPPPGHVDNPSGN